MAVVAQEANRYANGTRGLDGLAVSIANSQPDSSRKEGQRSYVLGREDNKDK